jgi:hypothetical protein
VVTWRRRRLHVVGEDGAARIPTNDARWIAAAVVLVAALTYAAVLWIVTP